SSCIRITGAADHLPYDLSTWIAAIVGSLILLALYRVITGNRRHA
ncbi:GlsB/YeaQ/YmgE family stress response membrane protein, partial [Streptomyces sp. NPDC005534]